MIKVYGMATCPDCTWIEGQIEGDGRYELVDIGRHVKFLKEFLRLRDTEPAFDEARAQDVAGIPCFVLEDGSVTLDARLAGLRPRPADAGEACAIDGSGC